LYDKIICYLTEGHASLLKVMPSVSTSLIAADCCNYATFTRQCQKFWVKSG